MTQFKKDDQLTNNVSTNNTNAESNNDGVKSVNLLTCIKLTSYNLLFFLTAIIVSIVLQNLLNYTASTSSETTCNQVSSITQELDGPVNGSLRYAVFGKGKSDIYLRHVHDILRRFGYEEVDVDGEWDLLWAHDYPFRKFADKLKNLQPHQRVNHFPGTGFITNKVDLAVSESPYIPKAFKIPKDKDKFLEYSNQYPNKLFVQKHNQHRHIQIKPVNKIDFSSNETFIQEFIDDPYLVDGHKFDIGIYVVITSVNPLRIYILQSDVLFRFCPVKYYPFDANNVDKYIVGDDYLPIWEVPALEIYYNKLKYGMKDSFDAYLRSINQDPKLVWNQIEDAVRQAVLLKEKNIVEILRNYKIKNHFFEMMRFDFVLTADLKVYLMEANMSPNLSSAHFKPNILLYEQVIYNLFNLVGLATSLKPELVRKRNQSIEPMLSADKNILVESEMCSNSPCSTSCALAKCRLCWPCMKNSDRIILHEAYRETLRKGDSKRIFPTPIENVKNYNIDEETKNLTEQNAYMTRWFYGKCKIRTFWCS